MLHWRQRERLITTTLRHLNASLGHPPISLHSQDMITKALQGSTACASVVGAALATLLVAAATGRIGVAMGNVGLSSTHAGGKAVIGSPSIMKKKVSAVTAVLA